VGVLFELVYESRLDGVIRLDSLFIRLRGVK
jgi:hypothetical protein